METFRYGDRTLQLSRYPATTDRSLRVANAADEWLLAQAQVELGTASTADTVLLLLHDRFGLLAACLAPHRPNFLACYRSQEKALAMNLENNQIDLTAVSVLHPLDEALPAYQFGYMQLPKSLDLFELYLSIFARFARPDAQLSIGFMTRHFSPNLLPIAEKYAHLVTQSKAKKKARLLQLSGFRQPPQLTNSLKRSLLLGERSYEQYYGVFSAAHIDYATQFLLQNWPTIALTAAATIVDIGCGNGVIGCELQRLYPSASLVFIDDFYLAIESAKLNVGQAAASRFLYEDDLASLAAASVDLVVTNPPFHFGHDNNIEVSLALFEAGKRVLKPKAQMLVVANKHLNYATHLARLFPSVHLVAANDKFVLYQATKGEA